MFSGAAGLPASHAIGLLASVSSGSAVLSCRSGAHRHAPGGRCHKLGFAQEVGTGYTCLTKRWECYSSHVGADPAGTVPSASSTSVGLFVPMHFSTFCQPWSRSIIFILPSSCPSTQHTLDAELYPCPNFWLPKRPSQYYSIIWLLVHCSACDAPLYSGYPLHPTIT